MHEIVKDRNLTLWQLFEHQIETVVQDQEATFLDELAEIHGDVLRLLAIPLFSLSNSTESNVDKLQEQELAVSVYWVLN